MSSACCGQSITSPARSSRRITWTPTWRRRRIRIPRAVNEAVVPREVNGRHRWNGAAQPMTWPIRMMRFLHLIHKSIDWLVDAPYRLIDWLIDWFNRSIYSHFSRIPTNRILRRRRSAPGPFPHKTRALEPHRRRSANAADRPSPPHGPLLPQLAILHYSRCLRTPWRAYQTLVRGMIPFRFNLFFCLNFSQYAGVTGDSNSKGVFCHFFF